MQVNFLVRIASVSVVDVTAFGSARALSNWSLRIDSLSNASRRFSRNVTCFPKFPRCMIKPEIQETNIFMAASVFITKRSATDVFNNWKVPCFCDTFSSLGMNYRKFKLLLNWDKRWRSLRPRFISNCCALALSYIFKLLKLFPWDLTRLFVRSLLAGVYFQNHVKWTKLQLSAKK